MNNKGKAAAFTIVEMMITVGIIGCLAAIVFPNFIKARASGHRSVCIANLKKIQDAKVTWAFEKNKKPSDEPLTTDIYGSDKYLRDAPKCPSEGVLHHRRRRHQRPLQSADQRRAHARINFQRNAHIRHTRGAGNGAPCFFHSPFGIRHLAFGILR
jgi:competence protein ComGC